MSETNSDTKSCPFCGETIKAQAIKCRFCMEFLGERPMPAQGAPGAGPAQPAAAEAMQAVAQVPAPSAAAGPAAAAGQPQEPGEDEVIYEGPISRVVMVGPVFTLIVCVAIGVLVVIIGPSALSRVSGSLSQYGSVPVLAGVAIALVACCWFLVKWLVYRNKVFRITSARIEFEEGIFTKRVENTDMWRVQDVHFQRSVVEALVGVGRILVDTSENGGETISIGPVPKARELFDTLQKVQRQADRRQGVMRVER